MTVYVGYNFLTAKLDSLIGPFLVGAYLYIFQFINGLSFAPA